MNFSSKLIQDSTDQLASLPCIGRKTALRLVLHLIKQDKKSVEEFGRSFIQLINDQSIINQIEDIDILLAYRIPKKIEG